MLQLRSETCFECTYCVLLCLLLSVYNKRWWNAVKTMDIGMYSRRKKLWTQSIDRALSLEDDFKVNFNIEETNISSNLNSDEELSASAENNNVETDAVMVVEPKEEASDETEFNKQESIEESIAGPSKENIYNTKALSKYDTTYRLEKFEKNFLMIFNQENIEGYKPRLGTEKDVQALKDTFSKFGFEAVEHKDLTKDEILRELKIFAEKDFTDYGCVAVVVLTHGTKHGLIRAKDHKYNEIEIVNYFKTYNKPTLITKPKILIIQACRGYKIIPGVYALRSGVIRTDVDEDLEPYTLPVEADMLILHSSYTGSPSHRDELRGSWFIQALCRKIEQFAAKLDLESIITEVKREVAIEMSHSERNRKTGEIDINKQMPVQTSTLIRKLYLRKFGDEPVHSTDEADLSRRYSEIVSEPTTPMIDFGQCPCFLDHYTYITNCLRYFLEANPDDKLAQAYLDISNTFEDGVEFNTPKEKMTKAICEYLNVCAKDDPYYKYIYMYKHGLEK